MTRQLNNRTRSEYDDLTIPQLILSKIDLTKKETEITKQELVELYDLIVDRRVHATGDNELIGSLNEYVDYTLGKNIPLQQMYERVAFSNSQFDQTVQLIDFLDKKMRFFEKRSLIKRFDEETATAIIKNRDDIKQARTSKKQLEYKFPSGFVQGVHATPIEIQLYLSWSPSEHQPLWIAVKHGKTAKSLVDKLAGYVPDYMTFAERDNYESLDPFTPIAYFLKLGENIGSALKKGEEQPRIGSVFKELRNTPDIEELLLATDGNESELKKEYEQFFTLYYTTASTEKVNEKRELARSLKKVVRQNMEQYNSERLQEVNQQAILAFGNIDDLRGVKFVHLTDAAIAQYTDAQRTNMYIKGSEENHRHVENGKVVYAANHWHIRSNRFSTTHPRFKKYALAERAEIHHMTLDGAVLDLLGPRNSWMYHQQKYRYKFQEKFSSQQKGLATLVRNRLTTFMEAVEPAFKELIAFRKSDLYTQESYIEYLQKLDHLAGQTLEKLK